MWETLGLLGVLSMWGALGLLGCCVTLIATRRPTPAVALPLAVAGGVAGALLVPALGARDAFGFAISLAAGLGAGAVAVFLTSQLDRGLKSAA